jgi:hypothetical protein
MSCDCKVEMGTGELGPPGGVLDWANPVLGGFKMKALLRIVSERGLVFFI